jgi:hypothetical protein
MCCLGKNLRIEREEEAAEVLHDRIAVIDSFWVMR